MKSFAEYLKRQKLAEIDAMGELLRLDEERCRVQRQILVESGRECHCPDHPGCHRVARVGRRHCSTCIDRCGPFTLKETS